MTWKHCCQQGTIITEWKKTLHIYISIHTFRGVTNLCANTFHLLYHADTCHDTPCGQLKYVQNMSLTSKAALGPMFLTVRICIPICCPSSNSLCESLGVRKKLRRTQAAITSVSTMEVHSLILW